MVTFFAVVVLVSLQFYLMNSAVVFNNYNNELQLGSTCRFNGNKSEGICRKVKNCPGAYRDYAERKISPTICAFDSDKVPLVCCGNKRRYEAACEFQYNDPDTDKVCPRRGAFYYCHNEKGSIYSADSPSGGIRAGPVRHMAAIGWKFDEETLYKCGGTLISIKFVLTAAHCTMFDGVEPSVVRIGAEHLLTEDSKNTFKILEVIPHPRYEPPIFYHDIALLRFDYPEKFYFPSDRQPTWPDIACLPPEHLIYDENIFHDDSRWGQLDALGYGATSFGGPTDDSYLIKVNIDLLPDSKCINSFPPDEYQPSGHQNSTQICAGDDQGIRDTCQGNSGGPLQRHFKRTLVSPNIYYVFGITSLDRGCATGVPGVYTRVTPYLDWIESIVWPTEETDGINLTKSFSCGEEQKLCLKKIRTYHKYSDPYWPEYYAPNDDECGDQDDCGNQTEIMKIMKKTSEK